MREQCYMVTKLSGSLAETKVKCESTEKNKRTTCSLVTHIYYFSKQEANLNYAH